MGMVIVVIMFGTFAMAKCILGSLAAIYNLVDNALKYSKQQPEISLKTTLSAGVIQLEIRDRGIGMSKEQQKALLDSSKENTSTKGTDNEEGTGLGFSICKDFIKRNNGMIYIESKEGKGSTFSFTVPTNLTRDTILKVS